MLLLSINFAITISVTQVRANLATLRAEKIKNIPNKSKNIQTGYTRCVTATKKKAKVILHTFF